VNLTTTATTDGAYIMGVILIIAIMFIIISVLCSMARSYADYKRIKKFLLLIGPLFSYAGYGLLTIVVVGTPCLIGYILYQHASQNPGATSFFLSRLLWVIIGFSALVGIGYVTKERLWSRIFEYHKKSVEETTYKENQKELPGALE